MGINLPKIAERHRSGRDQDADRVWAKDVTEARHSSAGAARQAGDAHRQRHSAERDHAAGALPSARLRARREARHVHERQRPRAEVHEGRRAARRRAAEWEFLHDLVYNVTGQDGFVTIEGLFNQMAKEVPAFNGLTWAGLGDTGVTVKI